MSTPTRRNVLRTFAAIAAAFAVTLAARPAHAESRAHARIDAAINALDGAQAELEHADHDFGGHKAEAMKKIEVAKEVLVGSRDHGGKKSEAVKMIEEAKAQLVRCEEYRAPHDKEESAAKRHPKIHQAIEALNAAREEL